VILRRLAVGVIVDAARLLDTLLVVAKYIFKDGDSSSDTAKPASFAMAFKALSSGFQRL
jgi:hypothetical protein